MNDEIKAKLERFLPLAVVLRYDDMDIEGRIEHSFSIDWADNRIRIWWSGKAYSMLGEHTINGPEDGKYNMDLNNPKEFLFDALDPELPIEINWEQWIKNMEQKPGDKFAKRNAPFTVKPHGVWQLRAMATERELAELKPRYKNVCKARDEADDKLEKLNELLNPKETENED